jgi:hypothetical protein
MNYSERAKQVTKLYRLSVLDLNRETLDLEDLITGELKAVAREARKQLRQDLKEKAKHADTTS